MRHPVLTPSPRGKFPLFTLGIRLALELFILGNFLCIPRYMVVFCFFFFFIVAGYSSLTVCFHEQMGRLYGELNCAACVRKRFADESLCPLQGTNQVERQRSAH